MNIACLKNIHARLLQKNMMVNGGKRSMGIKLVGSVAEKDEVHLIKNVTEVFLIEQRIRRLLDKDEEEGVSMVSV